MKKTIGFLFVVLLVTATTSFAQKTELKFGHINSQELLESMPERETARKQLEEYSQMLQKEMEAMQTEYQTKVTAYLEKQATFSDLVKKSKEQEIQEMQRRVQEFQQTAQQDYQQKQAELIQPIMDKAQAAIEKVGKDNGFIYIFDLSAGGVIYQSTQSIDVLPLAKKELGIVTQ
ncbi:MAG: OmpH family outer membrane protein [Bacteroidales bacterium]|jgi:outer membrane protein|nr:OmpH family outer membrane protein [Bacteroidales bacterium]